MSTYIINGRSHWDYMKRLHATFYIDKEDMWWPMILMEAIQKQMGKELGIPVSRV